MMLKLRSAQRVDIENLENNFQVLRLVHKRDSHRFPLSRLNSARLALNLALPANEKKSIQWQKGEILPSKGQTWISLGFRTYTTQSDIRIPQTKYSGPTTYGKPP